VTFQATGGIKGVDASGPHAPTDEDMVTFAWGMKIELCKNEVNEGRVQPVYNPRRQMPCSQFVDRLLRIEEKADTDSTGALLSKEELVEKVKNGEWVCPPMRGDRSDAEMDPWDWFVADCDHVSGAAEETLIRKWVVDAGLFAVIHTTFGHSPQQSKLRIWFRLDRPVGREEHGFLHMAFAKGVPFEVDPAMAKPSQPIYLPACPKRFAQYKHSELLHGKKFPVDDLLRQYREEIQQVKDQRSGALRGSGIRAPGTTIDRFNHHFSFELLGQLLEKHGYKRKSRSRFLAPGSKGGRAAVVLYESSRMVQSYHEPGNDKLAKRGATGEVKALDPFAVFCALDYHDNFSVAHAAAAKWLKQHAPEEEAEQQRPTTKLLGGQLHVLVQSLRKKPMIVKGMFGAREVIVVSGASNSGKTTLMQYQAMCIALGRPFAGHETIRTPTLWIAGEDMDNALYRMYVLCSEMEVDPTALQGWFSIVLEPVSVASDESMGTVHEHIAENFPERKPGVMYLDSKSQNWGFKDENSNDENTQFVRLLRSNFAERYDAASLVLHHLTKYRDKEMQTARGGGSLINDVDGEWRAEKTRNNMCALEPGSKLRIAPWSRITCAIKVVALDEKYADLRDDFGEMPTVSVPDLTNAHGVSLSALQFDKDAMAILDVLVNDPPARRKGGNAKDAARGTGAVYIAKKLGPSVTGKDNPLNGAHWVKRNLEKMQLNLLLDASYQVTAAGKRWYEDQKLGDATPAFAEEEGDDGGLVEREPGSDDE